MKGPASVILIVLLAVVFVSYRPVSTAQQTAAVAPAHFHHLHLNSVDPAAAAEYYAKAFSSVTKGSLAGFEGIRTTSRLASRPGNIYVLFTKVNTPPPTTPDSAIWHFGWNTPDARSYMEKFHALKLRVIQMYADPDGTLVEISSDALPGYLTKQQIADAKAKGATPTHIGGFQYLRGPDEALIENFGNFPAERFTHVHMFHEDPVCAQRWYATQLGATVAATHLHLGPTLVRDPDTAGAPGGDCKTPYAAPTWPAFEKAGVIREPSGYVLFDDVGLPIRPHHGPLASTRRQTVDHIGLSVSDLRATVARLKKQGVTVLEEIHRWGDTRAAMIEGPDRVALELVEAK